MKQKTTNDEIMYELEHQRRVILEMRDKVDKLMKLHSKAKGRLWQDALNANPAIEEVAKLLHDHVHSSRGSTFDSTSKMSFSE